MTALTTVRDEFSLPVRLSRSAIRDAFIETGKEPAWNQIVRFDPDADPSAEAFGWSVNFRELDRRLRKHFVDILGRVSVQAPDDDDIFSETPSSDSLCVTAYDDLIWERAGWSICASLDASTAIRSVFSPGDGRTIRLREVVAQSHGPEAVDALLAGLPLVEELEGGDLTPEAVANAYERALQLAAAFRETLSSCRVGNPEFFRLMSISPDFIYITTTESLGPIGLLRESAPDAFERAHKICEQILKLPDQAQDDFAKRACTMADSIQRPGNGEPVDDVLIARTALAIAANDTNAAEERRRADEHTRDQYLEVRDEWIAKNGSGRLRLAAKRGYKIEGLYRRERLATELPDFVPALPRGSKVEEILNPSEQALERETEALEKIAHLKIDGASVKLVHVKISPDDPSPLQDGEYVQVSGYLGRHTVWEHVDDDIPF